ncbi:MAG TPA: hypothetical protein PLY51_14495 [Microthrixaceae bacterium]|nr:hypothetical protein [Microthrixaceae bacterium]
MQGRDSYGIADGWWGTDGAWHQASESARSALREAMGGDEHPDGPPDAPPGSPSLWFLRPGEDRSIWSPGVLELEDGTSVPVHDALPAVLQPLAAVLPTTHAFAALRTVLDGDPMPWDQIAIAAAGCVGVALVGLWFVSHMLKTFRQRGYITRFS